jgi:SAM-dependent methyltransferase
MGFHTFDPDGADRLEGEHRFRFCSREELLQYLPREGTVLDLGSGTGFYTDEVAPFVERVLAADLQPAMHGRYREKGVPDNVSLLTVGADPLALADDSVDGAFSTMTFHETTTEASLADLARALAPGAPFVVVDWSRRGRGEAGPPIDERFDADRARELLAGAGLAVEHATERSETFHAVARR